MSLALLLAAGVGCAANARLKAGLERAGLREPMSTCMADRLASRLSPLQLRKVSALGNLRTDEPDQLSVDRFLYNIRALGDADILATASTSALVCSASTRIDGR